MTAVELSLALLVLLLTPGPTNTLVMLAGAERGFWPAMRLVPVELVAYLSAVLPFLWLGAAFPAQAAAARTTKAAYQARLTSAGFGAITTEIIPVPTFYFGEEYHQQYLAKNPGGYCGIGGTGVTCPIGLTA